MKKGVVRVSVLVVVVGMLGFAPAALALTVLEDPSTGHKVVHDDVNDLYWYWDVLHWANQTYAQQMTSIASELAGGYFQGTTGWHMAKHDEMVIWHSYANAEMVATFGLQYGGIETGGRFAVLLPGVVDVTFIGVSVAGQKYLSGAGTASEEADLGAWVVAAALAGSGSPGTRHGDPTGSRSPRSVGAPPQVSQKAVTSH